MRTDVRLYALATSAASTALPHPRSVSLDLVTATLETAQRRPWRRPPAVSVTAHGLRRKRLSSCVGPSVRSPYVVREVGRFCLSRASQVTSSRKGSSSKPNAIERGRSAVRGSGASALCVGARSVMNSALQTGADQTCRRARRASARQAPCSWSSAESRSPPTSFALDNSA